MTDQSASLKLKKTPLHGLHKKLGARLVSFAGYEMPVQYEGIMAEHLWTRKSAGLFDVSHMGQMIIEGKNWDEIATFLERMCPASIKTLKKGRQRYSQLLNERGGILDDFMVTHMISGEEGAKAFLVVNAGRKQQDFAHLQTHIPGHLKLTMLEDRALIALQGSKAREVLVTILPEVQDMSFLSLKKIAYKGSRLYVSCSGYTGEDGFEISIEQNHAEEFVEKLLSSEKVKPVGLGARDSLRLEAGLCLYGHDMSEAITPLEASLGWSIPKRRREEGGFIGAEKLFEQFKNGISQKRIGLKFKGRQPAREGAEIFKNDMKIGLITSGGFGPSLQVPIAMGLIHSQYAAIGETFDISVRGKMLQAECVEMPFVAHHYKREEKK